MKVRELVVELQETLRRNANKLQIDAGSVQSPTPVAIICRVHDGALVRLDVTAYSPAELSL